jgi:hypothetical protein
MSTTKMKSTTKIMPYPRRGDTITTGGGATGIFVGTYRGCDWIAYEILDFARMCEAFDALVMHHTRASRARV